MWVAGVAGLLESAQGIRDECAIGVLEPLLMWRLWGHAGDGLQSLHGVKRLHSTQGHTSKK